MKRKGTNVTPKGILAGVQLVVQLADTDVDLKQYSMHTGGIVLSMPDEVYIEGMECTGAVMTGSTPPCVLIQMRDFEAVLKPCRKFELEYGYMAAHHKDTVISECRIDFMNIHTEESLPLRITSVKMCFDDGRELDYTDKLSVFVMDELAGVA